MEIERKFLLNNIPQEIILESYDYIDIQQAYISTSPVIRIRKKNIYKAGDNIPSKEEYILTVKSKGLMAREEFELALDKEDYNGLLLKAEGNVISKKRYLIPLDLLTLELDVFNGDFNGLIIGEIEFPDEESAKKYNPPEYLSREVTFDNRFHNSSLSAMSREAISDMIVMPHHNN